MSAEQRNDKVYDVLSGFTVEQLESLLQAELTSDETDVALIKRVSAVLAEKTGERVDADPGAAWQKFLDSRDDPVMIYEDVIPAENKDARRRGRRAQGRTVSFRHVAAAAVVILALGSAALSVNAFGSDFLSRMVTWASETFGFVRGEAIDMTPEEAPEQLRELQALMDAHDISYNYLPTYIPEGYETKLTSFDEGQYYGTFVCQLTNGSEDEDIILQYREYYRANLLDSFQKEDSAPNEYIAGGISHSIAENLGRCSAVWVNGTIECVISVYGSEDELIRMIDSIYGGTN